MTGPGRGRRGAGQRKLLRWTVPGLAHVARRSGASSVLVLTIVEGFGALFSPTFHIPVIGNGRARLRRGPLRRPVPARRGRVFTVIRLRHSPQERRPRVAVLRLPPRCGLAHPLHDLQRRLDLLLYRGAQINARTSTPPTTCPSCAAPSPPRVSPRCWNRWVRHANEVIETVALLLALAVLLASGVRRAQQAPTHPVLAASTWRCPAARAPSGALLPVYSGGTAVDFDDPGEDDLMGGARSRTSPGRACSTSPPAPSAAAASRQCPAWNTDKPLSPKLLVMTLRDHALAKGP